MQLTFTASDQVQRIEACTFCGDKKAYLVSKIDYWDLHSASLVQCQSCQHIQLDPKLNDQQTEKGCTAYYIKEINETNPREQFRNSIRNFRRGILFAMSLKKQNIQPQKILEFGPGSGYFLDGIRFVFPDVKITVMDIVDEVLQRCREIHQFKAIKGLPDQRLENFNEKYDLIIARDLIEHINDPSRFIQNVVSLLEPGGYFHFITPNGYEDVWGHYMLWKTRKTPSELLINHVNYFDGKCLLEQLSKSGFSPKEYYTYEFKDFLKGKGWKETLKWSHPSQKQKTTNYMEAKKLVLNYTKKDVKNQWYISDKMKTLTYWACAYYHQRFIKLSPLKNRGHEIHGLFQKK